MDFYIYSFSFCNYRSDLDTAFDLQSFILFSSRGLLDANISFLPTFESNSWYVICHYHLVCDGCRFFKSLQFIEWRGERIQFSYIGRHCASSIIWSGLGVLIRFHSFVVCRFFSQLRRSDIY